jgi:hypothetical protein
MLHYIFAIFTGHNANVTRVGHVHRFSIYNENFSFIASVWWARKFKRKYPIRQRKITKFVSSNDVSTLEETVAAPERFQQETRVLMENYSHDFVINTDQSGCQYHMVFNRSRDYQGAKSVLVKKQNLAKTTHSTLYSILCFRQITFVCFLMYARNIKHF